MRSGKVDHCEPSIFYIDYIGHPLGNGSFIKSVNYNNK